MTAAKKIDPENEIFVRREDFDLYFSKPIPKATFFRWVDQGKVKKARDLDGWYKLNATLVHQGMPPVDCDSILSSKPDLGDRHLLYCAILQIHPILEKQFALFKWPSLINQAEGAEIRKLVAFHGEKISRMQDAKMGAAYCIGMMEALKFLEGR